MSRLGMTRRGLIGGAAGLAAASHARAAPKLPSAPVSLTIVDAGGSLQMTRQGFEDYARAKPHLVSDINFATSPPAELAGKVRAEQAGGLLDIDLCLCGNDSLAAGLASKLWLKLLPDYAAQLPNLQSVYLPGAWKMQGLADGCGVAVVFSPSGPLLEYMPARVNDLPTTAEELLAWTRAHPNRFCYGRPANSGPGHTFIEGLPYILKDKDPSDPVNGWDKTWSYLVALGKNIDYYPAGTVLTLQEMANGTRDIVVTIMGWDINPRVLGIVPKAAATGTLKGFHWIPDAQYMVVPRGVAEAKLAVLLDMMSFMLTPKVQAYTFDSGFLYPGPAVKNVTLDMAPEKSRKLLTEFGRPEYAKLIADVPTEVPLAADKLVYAFKRWDQQVGAKNG